MTDKKRRPPRPAKQKAAPDPAVTDHFINSLGKPVYCNPIGHDRLQNIMNTIAQHYREADDLDKRQDQAIMRALCIEGVDFQRHQAEYETWLPEAEFIGVLPEIEIERRYEFIRTRLVVTVTDLLESDKSRLAETCLLLNFKAATPEQVEKARLLFRGVFTIVRTTKAGAKSGQTEAEKQPASAEQTTTKRGS